MAALPLPDFQDFFAQVRETGLELETSLPFETSRGCWWGQKHHCTFCGLNGSTMAFRSKPAEQVLDEFRTLRDRHPGRPIEVVDNILDMAYFKTLLPALAQEPDPPRLFFEVKANLTRAQLRTLMAAGVDRIQPGIESLSDDVLRRMGKGLKGLQGVQLLKDCARLGMRVSWNLIAGFPGEDPEDYARMARWVPLLTHLAPPGLCSLLRLDRFSPLHTEATARGLTGVAAYPAYGHVYGLPPKELDRLAYYFEFAYADGREVAAYLRPLEEAVARWNAQPGSLVSLDRGDEILVLDGREGAQSPLHVLHGAAAWVLRTAEDLVTETRLAKEASAAGFADDLEAALEHLRGLGLLLSQGELHLALPLPAEA